MPTRYFSKELANNTFYLPDGKTPVNFEIFPSNVGVIALDAEKDKEIIAALDDAVSKRRGGIVPIDEQGYNELKKNRGGSRQSAAFQAPQRLQAMRSPTVFRAPPQIPSAPANPAATNGNGHAQPPAPAATAPSATPNLDAPVTPKRPATRRRSQAEKAKAPEAPPAS